MPQFGGYCTNGIVVRHPVGRRRRTLGDDRRQALHLRRQGFARRLHARRAAQPGARATSTGTRRSSGSNAFCQRTKRMVMPRAALQERRGARRGGREGEEIDQTGSESTESDRRRDPTADSDPRREASARASRDAPSARKGALLDARAPSRRQRSTVEAARAVVGAGDERRGEAALPLEADAGVGKLGVVGAARVARAPRRARGAGSASRERGLHRRARAHHLRPRLVEQVVRQAVHAGAIRRAPRLRGCRNTSRRSPSPTSRLKPL